MDKNMDQIKGRAQQAVGDLTNNDDMRAEGEKNENAGKVKSILDKGKDAVSDLADKAKNKVDDVKDK